MVSQEIDRFTRELRVVRISQREELPKINYGRQRGKRGRKAFTSVSRDFVQEDHYVFNEDDIGLL